MASFIDGLVSGEDARKVYLAKSKSVDELTIKAAKSDALDTKILGEEQDGWTLAKRHKTSATMARAKPLDRQLEDDVWSLLYKLGFKEFNRDRNFTIRLGSNAPARQIDIFAKDEDTVFIVECTHSQEQASKSIKALTDKINGIRGEVAQAIHAHFGKEPKLKIKWAIATQNVDWRKADKERAEESNIAIITEQEVAYYTKLTDYIKQAARYQFLARYLKGEKVDGLKPFVSATRGQMGGVTFYNFLISPMDLLKISYISHKATSTNDLETYQRMVKPTRLKNIAAYIDNGGQFPTNIVVNFKTKDKLNFQKMENSDDVTFGKLSLPKEYGSAWVVDGQHRLYGFAFAERGDNNLIPVLAYENLPAAKEMQLFIDINCEQVKVSRSLTHELFSNLNAGSDDPIKRLEAQYPRVAIRLDGLPTSPIKGRVLTVSHDKDHTRCLTLTSLADGIKENRFLGSIQHTPPHTHITQSGPFSVPSGDLELSLEKAADVISGYLNWFAQGVAGNWTLGDDKGGFLCTNNGLRALLRLLKELIFFMEKKEYVQAVNLDADYILEKIKPYVNPLVMYFANAEADEIQTFRSRQALDGVNKNCLGMMGIISEALPDFTNQELSEYLNTRDKEGTNIARGLIDQINLILFKDVLDTLKSEFGTTKDAWWWKGIPANTREKCDSAVNRDAGIKDRHQYLSLADYQTIVTNNWTLFDKKYDFGEKGKKADKVSWIGHINKIRQTTHHPEKGLISKDEVTYVKGIYDKVIASIVNV
jgi:DNA sulfur modification protein DndB